MTGPRSPSTPASRPARAMTARPACCSAGPSSKDDPRTDSYGTVDEAVAALGLARAELGAVAARDPPSPTSATWPTSSCGSSASCSSSARSSPPTPMLVGRQRDGTTRVEPAMVEAMGETLAELEAAIVFPPEFVVPGETRVSAALELARTIHAPRGATGRDAGGRGHGHRRRPSPSVPERLADLLWILARQAEQAEAHDATVARPDRTRGRGQPAVN